VTVSRREEEIRHFCYTINILLQIRKQYDPGRTFWESTALPIKMFK